MTHHLSLEQVYAEFKSSENGLSKKEAEARLRKSGKNILPRQKRFSVLKLFLNQLANPLVYILLVAFVISFITKHGSDALIILAVILINTLVGFFQEYNANKALESLIQLVSYKTTVLRDGQKAVIPQENLVLGDLVFLNPGDKVPADMRLIQSTNLQIIEASLTGESKPSVKNLSDLSKETPLADRDNMVYMGTVVAAGKGLAIVVATGEKTELGQIAGLVVKTEKAKTPLQIKIHGLSKTIGLILILVNAIIFIFGVLLGRPFLEMFLTAVAIVVSAVPEGLLPAMTVILAIGMKKLSKRKGLIRKMLAAETLGSVTVICTDKTGTLTKGEMRVSDIITETSKISHDGTNFSEEMLSASEASHFTALKISQLCNNAVIENPEKALSDWVILGDPTEKALILAGRSAGLIKEDLDRAEKRLDEISFDSQKKFMATLNDKNDQRIIYVKGAPEKVLAMSGRLDIEGKVVDLSEKKKEEIVAEFTKLTSNGLRVIATAYKLSEAEKLNENSLTDLVYVGLIAIKDPLRHETKHAIEQCLNAGVRPIMVTGDHKLTAMAIGKELGLKVNEDNSYDGADLDKMSDQKLLQILDDAIIFARVEPRHKIRIVEALQAKGEVVAMTGDGVNDAPAIKKADIGVAVGDGTDVAKETADLVLLDNNFKTIVEAVRRGRLIFNNIRKVVVYLMMNGFSEMVLVVGALLMNLPLPILPAQILWINMIVDAAPAMGLAFDETDEDVMKEKPRAKNEQILNYRLKTLILCYALIMDLTLLGIFRHLNNQGYELDYIRTVTFVGLGLTSLFYIYSVRGLRTSIFKINLLSNKFLIFATLFGFGLFALALYTPFFQNILSTQPIRAGEWLLLAGYAAMSLIVFEVLKKLTAKLENEL